MIRRTESGERGRGWRQWSEAEARAALTELARSAESTVSFARRKGVSPQRLQYWKKRLAWSPSPSSTPPAFVAVSLPAVPIERPEVEIRLGEVVVVVREGCNVELVARLVDALSRRARGC